VVRKLDELRAAGIQTLVIPGNHDIDMGSRAVAYNGDKTTPVASPTLETFATLYANYGYGDGSQIEPTSKSYCCEPAEGLTVIGINSGKDGRLSDTALDWVCTQAAAATIAGNKVIAMMHHALIPHITNVDLFVGTSVINDYDNIRQRLIDAGVKVILTGHFHTSDIAKDYSNDLKREIFDIATGALVSYPCDYRVLTLSNDRGLLEVATGHVTATAGNDKFSVDSVKTRLYDGMKQVVKNKAIAKIKGKFGDNGLELFGDLIDQVAGMVGDAFVLHALGDEYKTDTKKLLTTLTDDLLNSVMPGSAAMFLSMLKDRSPYGKAGRENQTDDLTLTINLGANGNKTAIRSAVVSDCLEAPIRLNDAIFYKFNYPSVNVAGEEVVLSSSLVAWMPTEPKETDSIESVHIYSHFTITADKECPSADTNIKERVLFTTLVRDEYGLFGDEKQNFISHCVLVAPDFEGYGVTRENVHPYMSQELTARQVADAVDYGLKLYRKHVNDNRALDMKSDWRSFGHGFSQGGAVALAVQRYIEQQGLDETWRYRGTIAGDGPYDLVATMRYYMEDDGESYGQKTDHRKGISTMPMVVPMIIKGMLDTHPDMKGHKLEDYLSQQFLDTGIMGWLESKEWVINDIHKKWYNQLQEGFEANGRSYTKEQMAELFESHKKNFVWGKLDRLFTTDFYNYLADASNFDAVPTEKGNPLKDLHRALADNSVATGWEPKHRIQFVHSTGDMVVPYGNYLSFRDSHLGGEGDRYRIDNIVSPADNIDTGTQFYLNLCTLCLYGDKFLWLDEDGKTTGITEVVRMRNMGDDSWYSLDGRRLQGKPATKGIYIYKGSKVVISRP
jgi:hypothetical protein